MSAITDITEPWRNHDGIEVETWLKQELASQLALIGGKFGDAAFTGSEFVFYDEPGGTVLLRVPLTGDVFTIDLHCDTPQAFYVLGDETSKTMTIAPTTSKGSIGSSETEPYPEDYTYTVAVNNGSGYITRIPETPIRQAEGGTATFEIRNFLSVGDNFVRVTVTGQSSGQVRSSVFTATVTTLWLTVTHAWQNVWEEGQPYTITGIRFAGAIAKALHVSVDGSEEYTPPANYSASQSYTTSPTTYTIPAEAFPATENGIHVVRLWMTAQGVSTRETVFNIMCVAEGDTTPLVTINSVIPTAINWTSGRIFSYAVYGADRVLFDLSALIGSVPYTVDTGIERPNLEEGLQYEFLYSLEIDTGANEEPSGTLTAVGTAYSGVTEGESVTVTTALDNTYSYVATPGALFYMNASTRTNSESNREYMKNEMGASADENFAASYLGTWTGFSWSGDAWAKERVAIGGNVTDIPALIVPAGCSVTFPDFAPLSFFGYSGYASGMTFEVMIKNSYPADYDTPILILGTTGENPSGIFIYPTKILVLGSYERSEYQSVNISENRMTHICVTFVKKYEGKNEKNLASIYINGISNVNFSFDASTGFGDAPLVIGQQNADTLVYRMRVYGEALDSRAVFNNFLNSIVDGLEFNRRDRAEKNNVLYGDEVSYADVKRAGYNTMVIVTPNDVAIPSYFNNVTVNGCTWRFEYAGHPDWDVIVDNIPIDGQGTTSKKYFRWNERGKTGSGTDWYYGDGTSEIDSKEGNFINDGEHIRVDRITAKKNIASSQQGHKMGMTGLYNDLFKQVGLGSHLPDPAFRVAVYQFPFVGFQYNSINDSYSYIGQYTAGPDKGSKVTFGYLKSRFPNCLSIEGPNHNPRGTRFLTPWVDVEYSYEDETLTFGGQEGWDVDYVKYETTTGKNGEMYPDDWAAIRALYESEWRPAYEVVYNNSPHIASVAEVIAAVNDPNITTLAHLLDPANVDTVAAATVPGMLVSVGFIAFYDTDWELYFFRNKTGHFEKLADVAIELGDNTLEHNVKTPIASYLSTQSPTTAQLRAARAARFKATAADYWDIDQTLYHYAFCELYAVSDNFAKNSYPFKFRKFVGEDLASGESVYVKRWGHRQDDMDTVMLTDNNGNQTKKYSVEPGDTTPDGVQIFQGYNSALWVLIHDNYFDEIRAMMLSIAQGAQTMATNLGIAGSGLHGSLFNLTSYYCWEQSAKYFAETLYEKDRRWAYIEPWLLAGTTNPQTGEQYPSLYNGVPPLTQALGDQYQGERLWMERRIPYIFSKYHIGAFSGATEGYNMISFTLAQQFTFHLTPAIDLYPTATSTNDTEQDGRKQAGQVAEITLTADGQSNNYIKGGDWLSDLGDLSGMALSARGGGDIAFDIACVRLLSLKVGDAVAGNVAFNAQQLTVNSPSITSIDARNTTTVRNLVNLSNCPRLRTVLFAGSGATGMILPIGAKVTEVSFPSAAQQVYLQSLPFLTAANLTLPTLTNVVSLYVYDCPYLNPFGILATIFGTTGNVLAYATVIWLQTLEVGASTVELLTEMTSLQGSVSYEDGAYANVLGSPSVEGTLRFIEAIYTDVFDNLQVVSEEDITGGWKRALSNLFHSPLYLEYNPSDVYIKFVDANVKSICVTNWGSNGEISLPQAEAVTNISTTFRGNSSITSFDEFKYWTGVTQIYGNNSTSAPGAFGNCTNLESITLPPSVTSIRHYAFYNCTSLEEITFSRSFDANVVGIWANCNSLVRFNIPSADVLADCVFYNPPFNVTQAGHLYVDGVELTSVVISSALTTVRGYTFRYCVGITSLVISEGVTSIGNYAFDHCSGLTSASLPSTLTTVSEGAFNTCSSLLSITLPASVTSIGGSAFRYCSSLKSVTILGNVGIGAGNVFTNCTALEEFHFLGTAPRNTSNSQWFSGCSSLIKVYFTDFVQSMSLSVDSDTFYSGLCPFTANTDTHYVYFNDVEVRDLVIPNTVTTISAGACYRWNRLMSVSIPSSVTKIRTSAFQGCSGLTGVLSVPSTVTTIGSNVFNGCTGLSALYVYGQRTGTTLDFSSFITAATNGVIYIEGVVGGVTNPDAQCEKLIVGGYNNTVGATRAIVGRYYVKQLRIIGNYTNTGNYGIISTGANSTQGELEFVELLGKFTTSNGRIWGADGMVKSGVILHLGYDTVTNNELPCTPTNVQANVSNVTKVYVGDGSSAAHDDAILAMYTADSAWSAYSAKLDTWYNYNGEYKTPPTIPTV